MLYTIMHGKIHRATVTEANLEYMGSVTIDSELMEMAGILPGERVQIVDNNNGARLETYTIAGAPGSGVICLNGAAARLVQPGDKGYNYGLRADDGRRSAPLRAEGCNGGRSQQTAESARHGTGKRNWLTALCH